MYIPGFLRLPSFNISSVLKSDFGYNNGDLI